MTLDQYERASLRRELKRWGAWQDRRDEFNGYPSEDTISRYTNGRGGGIGGHRILMMDMPDDVSALHQQILKLPLILRDPLYALYVGILKEDGTPLTYGQRFERIGLTQRTGWRRIEEAMTRLHLAINSPSISKAE